MPQPLVLSRTRDFGIDLGPLGLSGLVLDSRAGLHVACIAAAQTAGLNKAIMLTTSAALINIAAYDTGFRTAATTALTYGVHGRIAFDALEQRHESDRDDGTAAGPPGRMFEDWFLPLCAMKDKNGVDERQLDPLRKHFRRSWLAAPSQVDADEAKVITDAIKAGDMDWVRQKDQLAIAIAMARQR